MPPRPLDLDVAIYRDRVQVTNRATATFADQRATHEFSNAASVVAQPRYLEDTIVRAIRQLAHEDRVRTNGSDMRPHVRPAPNRASANRLGRPQCRLGQSISKTTVFMPDWCKALSTM